MCYGLLGFVGVCIARIHLEFSVLGATEARLWKHAPHGAFNEQYRPALAHHAWGFHFLTTHISGEAGVNFGGFLGAAEDDLVGIGYDDEIASVDVRGKGGLVLSAKQPCGFDGDLTKDFVFGIDHIPLAIHFVGLGGKCLHIG